MITLLPPALKRRGMTKADVGAFVLTSGILAIFDNVRDETKALLSKGESWRVSWLKHSTPLSADYFFRNDNAADRVTFLGIVINVLLSAGKFAVGVSCHSSALIADAGHSLSDLFSDFVTLWAVQVARLPPDDDHPYGHGKLLGTGLSVGASSYVKFLRVINAQRSLGVAAAARLVEIPTWPALVMAGASIFSKEWLYRITRRVGEELNSQVVIANAWHHRSDAYSSVLALVSIGLAMAYPGFLAADPAAGVLVAGMIAMTGAEIMGESVKQLTDAMTDEDLVKSVGARASDDADVRRVTRVRARRLGDARDRGAHTRQDRVGGGGRPLRRDQGHRGGRGVLSAPHGDRGLRRRASHQRHRGRDGRSGDIECGSGRSVRARCHRPLPGYGVREGGCQHMRRSEFHRVRGQFPRGQVARESRKLERNQPGKHLLRPKRRDFVRDDTGEWRIPIKGIHIFETYIKSCFMLFKHKLFKDTIATYT